MKNSKTIFGVVLSTTFLITGCSSVKISDTWNDIDAEQLTGKNILVISKTEKPSIRKRFEKDLTQMLNCKNLKATESYKKFPDLNSIKEGTPKQLKEVGKSIKDSGYDIVVLSVLKDVEEYSTTSTSSTTYAINTYPVYYSRRGNHRSFYRGFNTVYVNGGPYETITTTNKKYILETMVYDLTKEEDEQLMSIVTTTIDNPETLSTTSKDFSKRITKELTK